MKIPTRKGYRATSIDARDPANIRVLQWEKIGKPDAPADHISDARQKVIPRGVAAERQGLLI